MQLPKTPRGQRFKEKKCLYPGCGRPFHGIHISKYCVEHRKDMYRIRKRTKPEDVNLKNQTIQHKYTTVVEQTMNCALEQCENQFTVKIFPRLYVYPKFCPDHRNEYKRERHLRQIGREDLIEAMKADPGTIEVTPHLKDDLEDEDDEIEGSGQIEEDEAEIEEEMTTIPEDLDFTPTEDFDESLLNVPDDEMI